MPAPDVLIVDDHPMTLEFLSGAAARALPGSTVRTATHLDHALDELRVRPADLVLLDLGLPGCEGIEALLRLCKAQPETRIAIVSAEEDRTLIRAALAAGAAGYIPKTAGPKVIVGALRLIGDGGIYVPAEAIGETSTSTSTAGSRRKLTDRQEVILARMLKGRSNAQIARELGISEATVKQHAHAMYVAFGVSSRADLILAATGKASRAG